MSLGVQIRSLIIDLSRFSILVGIFNQYILSDCSALTEASDLPGVVKPQPEGAGEAVVEGFVGFSNILKCCGWK